MARITTSFTYLVLKKLITNKRKFFTFLTGLILSTALLSGISIFVDVTSQQVLNSYFEEDRTIDILIKTSSADPRDHANYLRELGTEQQQFNWLESFSAGYRWHIPLLTHLPPENITPDDAEYGVIAFVYSVDKSFSQNFNHLFEILNGSFDLGPGKGVVSDNVASMYSISVGDNISLFSWMQSTTIYFQNEQLRAINRTAMIQVTGIVSASSKFFSRELIADLSPGFSLMSRMGCVFTGLTALPETSYYQQLRFQPSASGIIDSFDNIVFVKSNRHILNLLNPDASIEKISMLGQYSRAVVGPATSYVFISPLINALEEYRFWLTSARVFLVILSMPVILTGWYLLNFSFSHTFDEKKKEISSMKSRGFSNTRIWFIIIFEALVLGIIGATTGLILGIFLNAVLETSTSFMVFDLLKFNLDSISAITPFTLLIAAATSIIIMIIVSILPVRSVIDLPIDEITQEEQISITENFSRSQLKVPTILMLIGFIIIGGLFTSNRQVSGESFLIILTILGLITFIIGSLTLMSNIARFLPFTLEKLRIGLNSPHLFLVARELSRRSKKTTAAFVVLALTLAFGIFSSLTIQSSNVYLLQDSYFEIGSDIAIEFSGTAGFRSVPVANYERLMNPALYPEVKDVVKFLHYPGYIMAPEEEYPLSAPAIQNRILNTLGSLVVMFINSTEYRRSVYCPDYFIESNETDPILALGDNPGTKVLIDRETAAINGYAIGDTIKFTTGRYEVYEGLATIAGLVDYFSPGFVTGEDSFIIVDRDSLQDEFDSAEFSSTWFMIELEDSSRGFDVADRILKDQQIFGVGNVFSVQGMTAEQSEDFVTLLQTLNLDFYYSLIVSAIGFLIVLEIRVQERKKEIGAIKALGMSNNQTISMIMLEGGVSIIIASLTGLITGIISGALIMPILLIRTIPPVLSIPFDIFGMQLLLAVIFAFFGTLIPAILTNKWVPADLIKYQG